MQLKHFLTTFDTLHTLCYLEMSHYESKMSCKLQFIDCYRFSLLFYSESEILHHDKQYEPFYSSFVALSAHYITTVCGQSMSDVNILF